MGRKTRPGPVHKDIFVHQEHGFTDLITIYTNIAATLNQAFLSDVAGLAYGIRFQKRAVKVWWI